MAHIFTLDSTNHIQQVKGSFVYPNSKTSLNLHWQLDMQRSHYRALNVFLNNTHVVSITSRKNIQKLDFIGIARSSNSHMDQLVLLASYGDMWPEDIIFVFYDSRTRQFLQHYAASKNTDIKDHPYLRCSSYQQLKTVRAFQPCKSLWEAASKNAVVGEKIYRELKPIKILSNRRRGRNILATRLIPTQKLEASLQTIKAMRDPNFYMETVDENTRWKIFLVSFDSPDRDSWGLLFAFDKQKQQWLSFYSLPKSSMVSLFIPVVELISESTLKLNTCIDCRMWGKKTNLIVNMETMVASVSLY